MENLINYLNLIESNDKESILLGLNLIKTDKDIYNKIRNLHTPSKYFDRIFDRMLNNFDSVDVFEKFYFMSSIREDLNFLIGNINFNSFIKYEEIL